MSDPIRHPTYGTLADLMAAMEADLAAGYYVRIGMVGALSWFVTQYQTAEPHARQEAEARRVVGPAYP